MKWSKPQTLIEPRDHWQVLQCHVIAKGVVERVELPLGLGADPGRIDLRATLEIFSELGWGRLSEG